MVGYQQFDMQGRPLDVRLVDPDEVEAMTSPVRCAHCGRTYDMGAVEVTTRYSDCSVWTSPCCRRTVDDRGPGWKSFPDFERVRY